MNRSIRILCAAAAAGCLTATIGHAGDVLFYYGHGGFQESHTQFSALIAEEGGAVDFNGDAALPSLAGYRLIIINVPGRRDANAFFSDAEKAALSAFLADPDHKVVAVGEWEGFYAGEAVLIDLIDAIAGGTGISFVPGGYDSGCFAHGCSGALGESPFASGAPICRAYTATWNPGSGRSVAFTVDDPTKPWIVDSGIDGPCIVGIGDSNTLSDTCDHLSHPGTAIFAKRLYTVRCSDEPVQIQSSTWGALKSTYR